MVLREVLLEWEVDWCRSCSYGWFEEVRVFFVGVESVYRIGVVYWMC